MSPGVVFPEALSPAVRRVDNSLARYTASRDCVSGWVVLRRSVGAGEGATVWWCFAGFVGVSPLPSFVAVAVRTGVDWIARVDRLWHRTFTLFVFAAKCVVISPCCINERKRERGPYFSLSPPQPPPPGGGGLGEEVRCPNTRKKRKNNGHLGLTRHPSGRPWEQARPARVQVGRVLVRNPTPDGKARHSRAAPAPAAHAPKFTGAVLQSELGAGARTHHANLRHTIGKGASSFPACSRTLCRIHWTWTPPSSSRASARKGCSGSIWMARCPRQAQAGAVFAPGRESHPLPKPCLERRAARGS